MKEFIWINIIIFGTFKFYKMKSTHIFICSYNRHNPLQHLVNCLLSRGYNNIVILDNQSTYKPLLDWYKTLNDTPVVIYNCKHNYGPGALDRCRFEEEEFRSRYLHIIENEYHVYTDSDVVPVDEIPNDFIDDMVEIAKKYEIPKLGLSLRIDDLPEHFSLKQQVIAHEGDFFHRGYIADDKCQVFKAPVDTTFALNAPGLNCGLYGEAYRMGGLYFARHAPWYYDTNNLPDDEKYYYQHITQISHWSGLIKQQTNL
jgi:glycosyltransferase involved in cell wall biosynthesis